jgi:NADH-quinone oxidoreductase subunit M
MFNHLPILSLLVWLPIMGGAAIGFFFGKSDHRIAQWSALFIAMISFLLNLLLLHQFDTSGYALQFIENEIWISFFNIHYALAIDGISLPLLLLNNFLNLVIILISWNKVKQRTAYYFAALLILSGLINGVFSAIDALLFYVFWEALLLPVFFLIGLWGEKKSRKSFIYLLTVLMSALFFLIVFLYLAIDNERTSLNFDLFQMYHLKIPLLHQPWIFFALLLPLLSRMSFFPLQMGLVHLHAQSPTSLNMLLTIIMANLGGYGFIRLIIPIVPNVAKTMSSFFITFSLITIVIASLMSIYQTNLKKWLAYSSISHMGFVILGLFVGLAQLTKNNTTDAIMSFQGVLMQMFAYGLIASALFLVVGLLYERVHSSTIKDYGGVIHVAPKLAIYFILFSVANIGLPGTIGFLSEFMIILVAFKVNLWVCVLAASIFVLSTIGTFYFIKKIIFSEIKNENIAVLKDIHLRDKSVLFLFSLLIIFLGIWPHFLLELFTPSIQHLFDCHLMKKLFLIESCKG